MITSSKRSSLGITTSLANRMRPSEISLVLGDCPHKRKIPQSAIKGSFVSSLILMSDQAQLTNPGSMDNMADIWPNYVAIGKAVHAFLRREEPEERQEDHWCYTFVTMTTSSSGRLGLIPAVFPDMDAGLNSSGKRQIVVFETISGCATVWTFYQNLMNESMIPGCFGLILVQPIPRRDTWLNAEGLRVSVLPEPQATLAEVLSNNYQYPDRDIELQDNPQPTNSPEE